MPNRGTCLPAVLLALSSLLLAGCNQREKAKPVGDVLATVNGRVVTIRDLNAEARARGVRFDTREGNAQRAAMLEFLVARTMLVDAAAKARLDRTPEVLADRLRADANILAQAQVKRWTSTMPGATGAQINAFRAENPQVFAGRQALTVEQIQVPSSVTLPKITAASIGELADMLRTTQIPNQRGRTVIDSANLPKATVAALQANPGAIVRIDGGPAVSFLSLVSAKPIPTPEQLQMQAAAQLMQRQNLDRRIAAEIARLRKAGRITYREGYAPTK
ncbi:MAG: hypothetical protein V4659_07925 [Pseudomonadota bacterium]